MVTAAQRALLKMAVAKPPAVPQTEAALQHLRRSGGRLKVQALAQTLGCSRRSLERHFQRELGISPKRYARIVRVQAVLSALAPGERAQWVEQALAAGYFDQAHLLHDFRELAGRSPAAARDADGELARHFTRPERLRALLGGH